MDPTTFRTDFPEFADTSAYPDSSITFWINVAAVLILQCVWCDVWPYGTELFIAHNLALEKLALNTAASGGVPGLNFGVTSGKTVDKLSITYDAQAGLVKDEGHWNLTTYGTRFIMLANLAGMGGYQAGAGAAFGAPGQVLVIGGFYGSGWPYYGTT